MSFSFNSQMTNQDGKNVYTIQITTDNYEQFKFIQDCARECVDGKHTEGVLSIYQKLVEDYKDWGTNATPITNVPDSCKSCPNHPSNGGSGICNCTLGQIPITCTNDHVNAKIQEDLHSATVTIY